MNVLENVKGKKTCMLYSDVNKIYVPIITCMFNELYKTANIYNETERNYNSINYTITIE